MDAHLFKLSDRAATLHGLVVIFDTAPQRLWVRFADEDAPREIEHSVAPGEVEQLRGELAALACEEEVGGGPTLVGQLFRDAAVVRNYRASFLDKRDYPVFAVLDWSLRQRVESWYQELTGGDAEKA